MGFGAGQIVYEDDLAAFIARQTYQEVTTVTNATVTLADVPGSQFTVVAGATYWVDVWLAIDGPVAGDAKFAWSTSDVNITLDRNIQAASTTVATNVTIPDMVAIRRGNATQQVVGTQGSGGSAFMVYHELCICKSVAAADGTAKMQVAQSVATAPGVTVQSGYMLINRIA